MILRAILLAIGLAALVGALVIDRPESFAITLPCALLTMVVGVGAVAADAVPLRRIALACSVGTVLLGAVLLGRDGLQAPVAAGIVALQVAAGAATRWVRSRSSGSARSAG